MGAASARLCTGGFFLDNRPTAEERNNVSTGTAAEVRAGTGYALWQKALAEGIGVAFLVMAFLHGGDFQFLVTGIALGIGVLLWTSVSGGYLNPAVALVALWRKAMSVTEFAYIVIGQLVGALVGVIVANWLTPGHKILDVADAAKGAHDSQAFVGELIGTAGLVFLVFWLIANGLGRNVPLGLTGWVAAASVFIGGVTGAAFFNPALTFGVIFSGLPIGFGKGVLLMVAELVGGLAAGFMVSMYGKKA